MTPAQPAVAVADRSPAAACDHCSLPVPAGLVDPHRRQQFCCQGCRMVYEAIHGCGLGHYYDLVDESTPAAPARTTGGDYASFDHAAFQERYVERKPGDPLNSVVLFLESVHCAACIWLLEKLPAVVPGVIEVRVDFGRQVARVVWDGERVALSRIARVLDTLGYPPHPYRESQADELRRREGRRHLIRIGVAGAIAGNVMLIAFALFGGMFDGMEAQYRTMFRWTSLLLTLLALAWPGRVFLVGALSSVRARVMHMDLPVAVALTAGTAWGAANTIRGVGQTYFESLTAVIFLLLVGRWIQHRQQRRAQDAVEMLYRLTPVTARLIDSDGETREVPVEALQAGSHVDLRAGDTVPADGRLVEGRSGFDLSLLTGESRPVSLGPGARLHAGTVNLTSHAVLEVQSTGTATRVGRLMNLVDQLARERPPVVGLADRVAHYFVIVVLAWAALTLGLWWRVDPGLAVENAIALLIVTCPCALGLATPLAVVAAIGRAASSGILIKGGGVLESLARPGLILLDKTGTLTRGGMELVLWKGDESIQPLVRAVESRVAHPIAQALVRAFEPAGPTEPATGVRHVAGAGVLGRVAGRRVLVGSPAFVRGRVAGLPDWALGAEQDCLAAALSPVLVAVDGTVRAVAGLGDPVLEDAAASIERLRAMGWKVRVLSGDHPAVVRAVAQQVGVDAGHSRGGASPERKTECIGEAHARHDPVVMVGDGVNDAPALSAATVGVAVHGGAEASLAAADVFLRKPGLLPVVRLIEGSRRAMRVIRRNIAVSLLYNLITAGLATAGMINPLIAAILMPISSLTVVSLSYRSPTFEG